MSVADFTANSEMALFLHSAVTGTYTPLDGDPSSILVIREGGKQERLQGEDGPYERRQDILKVLESEVSSPGAGDVITIGSQTWTLVDDPIKTKEPNHFVLMGDLHIAGSTSVGRLDMDR